jgi:lactoylglutathione lyase
MTDPFHPNLGKRFDLSASLWRSRNGVVRHHGLFYDKANAVTVSNTGSSPAFMQGKSRRFVINRKGIDPIRSHALSSDERTNRRSWSGWTFRFDRTQTIDHRQERMLMQFTFVHNNINVLNLDKSLDFYQSALNLIENRRWETPDFTLVYLGDGRSQHQLELTWLKDRTEPYDLGDNEIHLAIEVDDYAGAHDRHKKMGCICYENEEMGLYFIADPDGYWIEIMPERKRDE